MAISRFNEDLDIIQKLDTYPNDTDGLSADELKERFDRAGNLLKTFLNEVLIPELAAENIPFTASTAVDAANIQKAIENVQKQISNVTLNMIPDRTVTRAKLAKSLDDLLSSLSAASASHTSAIAELNERNSVPYAKTLMASGWTGIVAPYQYDLDVGSVAADKNVAVFFGESISENARNQAIQKNVRVSSVEAGRVHFHADSVPLLDIPVSILIVR